MHNKVKEGKQNDRICPPFGAMVSLVKAHEVRKKMNRFTFDYNTYDGIFVRVNTLSNEYVILESKEKKILRTGKQLAFWDDSNIVKTSKKLLLISSRSCRIVYMSLTAYVHMCICAYVRMCIFSHSAIVQGRKRCL